MARRTGYVIVSGGGVSIADMSRTVTVDVDSDNPVKVAQEAAAILPAASRYPTLAGVPTAFDQVRQNTTGANLLMVIRAGVVSDPGQNGHIYFEVSHNNSEWRIWDYVACRNEANNTDAIGVGKGLMAMVPASYYYRLRTATIATFQTPTFVLDSPQWLSYCQVA